MVEPFTYTGLEKTKADQLRKTAERIRTKDHDTLLEIGRDLLKVKDLLDHGKFVSWVQSECELEIRTAQRAMAAARVVEKNDKLSFLPIEALNLLDTARFIPKKVTEAVEAGNRLTAAQVREILEAEFSPPESNKPSQPQVVAEHKSKIHVKMAALLIEQQELEAEEEALEDLTTTWDEAKPEIRTLFRKHIGCTCGPTPEETAEPQPAEPEAA